MSLPHYETPGEAVSNLHPDANTDRDVFPLDSSGHSHSDHSAKSSNATPILRIEQVDGTSRPLDFHLLSNGEHIAGTEAEVITPLAPNGPRQLDSTKRRSLGGILHAWKWELLACLFAVLMLVIEVLLLHRYNNYPQVYWSWSWKINSIFAFFSTIMEACVGFVIGACLGQLRWRWFQPHKRELWWLDRLANARLPSGAVHFLSHPKAWRHWAALGACMVLSLLGIGVFTQQVIVPEYGPVSNRGYVPIAKAYHRQWEHGDQVGHELPSIGMQSAIMAGFAAPDIPFQGRQNALANYVACLYGECTFKNYSSLAICSTCDDISHNIINGTCNTTQCQGRPPIHLADRSLSRNQSTGWVNITASRSHSLNGTSTNGMPLIAYYQALVASTDDYPPLAVACTIYWCIQTLNSTLETSNGTYRLSDLFEELVDSTNVTPPWSSSQSNFQAMPDTCYRNGSQCARDEHPFTVGITSHTASQNFLVGYEGKASFLSGFSSSNWFDHTHFNGSTPAADALVAPCNMLDTFCARAFRETLTSSITSMTEYMTVYLRQNDHREWSSGSMITPVMIVQWPWLAYPITILTLTLIFVTVTIYKSSDVVEPWKSSVVALMIHGMDPEDVKKYYKPDDPEAMEKAQTHWSVCLVDVNGMKNFRWQADDTGSHCDEKTERPAHVAEPFGDAALQVCDNA